MPPWLYAFFVVLISALIIFDLCILHRKAKAVSINASLAWTCIWITVALSFNVFIYLIYDGRLLAEFIPPHEMNGREAAIAYFTAYLIEYSLSVDNIFVIAMIIANFRVPAEYQHRLLFWGVLGAAVLRGVMIIGGAALIHRFDWIIAVFGVLLILSAAKMLVSRHDNIDPENNLLIRLTRKIYPVTSKFHGQRFFAMENGVRVATPMLLALILIESCDVMFAIDSIPAVFAVTKDPFIVFTSNIFAILGLRSLYFALAGMMDRFSYLKMSLVFLLVFVGAKMLMSYFFHYHIPNEFSIGIIMAILAVGVGASIVAGGKDTAKLESPLEDKDDDGKLDLE